MPAGVAATNVRGEVIPLVATLGALNQSTAPAAISIALAMSVPVATLPAVFASVQVSRPA